MKILLTNDDGFHAPGIQELYHYLKNDYEVKICAPSSERSSTGHCFSLTNPLWLDQMDEDTYSCSGYPADCAFLGLSTLYKDDELPDLVISGINKGGNLGQDIYYSGTLAAAREATLRGVPAIGISLCTEFDFGVVDHLFITAAKLIKKFLENGLHQHIKQNEYLNINVPNVEFNDLKGIRYTELGRRIYGSEVEKRYDPRGTEYWWNKATYHGVENTEGSDGNAILERSVSVTVLNVFPAASDQSALAANSAALLD